MKKHLLGGIKLGEDRSDALSTATNNSNHMSAGERSPGPLHTSKFEENDSISGASKKIRKKRNAYQKIEDDVRLKLLEAVQRHGETLKSAAKKYKINYSSAKSILHTYRKEGRILKKSAQERNLKRSSGQNEDDDGSPNHDSEHGSLENTNDTQIPQKPPVFQPDLKQEPFIESHDDLRLNNMTPILENLANLIKSKSTEAMDRQPQASRLKPSNKPTIPRPTTPDGANMSGRMIPELTTLAPSGGMEAAPSSQGTPMNLMNLTQLFQGGNPMDKLRLIENFCPNIPVSPMSQLASLIPNLGDLTKNQLLAGNKMLGEPSGEMVIENRGQGQQGEEIMMPHPLRFNSAQLLQEKIETKLSNNEEVDWDTTIESAAIDTFKSFMDAQLLLCDALKKASYLNNLMQMQKSKPETPANNGMAGKVQGFKNV